VQLANLARAWLSTPTLIAVTFLALLSAQDRQPLVLLQTIELPGVEGRIDHLAVDRENQRLFVAALGNNTVEVIDLRAGTHLRSLAGFSEPQGIAVPLDGQIVATANGQRGDISLIERANLQPITTVPLGDDPDNVRYDQPTRRIFVGYGGSAGAIAALDVKDGRTLGEVRVSGHPESFQLEKSGPRIFVNVPTARQIAVVDRAAMKLLTTWAVTGAQSNFPMALDEGDKRIFIGCRQPAKVLILDSSSGHQVGSADIVGDTDDLFYDAVRKRLYVSGGEGFVDVFQQDGPDRLMRAAHIASAAGARTSLFVSELNRFYLAVPHRGEQKASIRAYEVRD
jgi:DNA-binding beta-propeller fold protein YncE